MAAPSHHLGKIIVEFCRFAREMGLSAGVKESLDALRAIQSVGVEDRRTLKFALRAVCCSSKAEWDLFESLFEEFWSVWPGNKRPAPRNENKKNLPEVDSQKDALSAMGKRSSVVEEDDGKAVLGATVQERLKKTDFSEVQQADLADLEKIALRLLQQMSLRLSRRRKHSGVKGHIDLRRTIRHSISHGGEPIDLSFRERKLQQLKLVIVLDISGSMNPYSIFFVRFVYALQKYFKRVDTFLFSTQLTEITAALKGRNLRDAIGALAQHAAGWSGGTKIGESLRELRRLQGRRLFSRDTMCIILSDGWETGDPNLLAEELGDIQRRVRKLIWLNPLLGMADYQPLTRGMSAALPHIDVFASAHNLESLLQLENHLRAT